MVILARSHAGSCIAAVVAALCLLLDGCSGSPSVSPKIPVNSPPTLKGDVGTTTPITHLVVVVQENRSFDNLFSGYPGAVSATSGVTHTGAVIPLQVIGLEDGLDIDHGHGAFVVEFDNGKMDAFDQINFFRPGQPPQAAGTYPYARISQTETQPYWNLASSYTLADHMFSTMTSGSFTAHQFLIAGTAALNSTQSLVDFPSGVPWGCDAPPGTFTAVISSNGVISYNGPYPCLNSYPTIAQLLDAANVSWKYYAPAVAVPGAGDPAGLVWSAFDAIQSVRQGPDWQRNVVSPETTLFTDIENGTLPQVSWVIPDFANSDHPESRSNTGPSWVTSIVNFVGKSKYWNNTAVVILWDEWGGWYDDVAPPQLDYTGLGMRVPMLVVSPYARKGYISHTQYEFGSILKFIEQDFSLPSLGTTDARATSIQDCFDFTASPSPFAAVRAPLGFRQMRSHTPSHHWVDDE